jgi:hypothetical protein
MTTTEAFNPVARCATLALMKQPAISVMASKRSGTLLEVTWKRDA